MTNDTDTADLLYGASAIAKFLGIPEKAARYRIAEQHVPTFRMGGMICARRSTINAWMSEQEAKAAEKRAR